MTVESEPFQALDGDQRCETVTRRLPFRPEKLRSVPQGVVAAAAPLFAGERAAEARFDG